MTSETAPLPQVELNNGVQLPRLGYGTFDLPAGGVAPAVRTALEAGYRQIDTAQEYENEQGVGEGIRQSGVPREKVFLTTKLANDAHGHDNAITALEGSLRRLGLDYVDLYLIHWPRPAQDKYVRTWLGFEELLRAGKTRAIGVSNFGVAELDRLAQESPVVPAVNQIELHPALQQADLRAYHASRGIVTQAWSPLGQGEVLTDPLLAELARKYGRTSAQIVLRWHVQIGTVAIPKSADPQRIRENLAVSGFELTEADLAAIGGLEAGRRTGPDPAVFRG